MSATVKKKYSALPSLTRGYHIKENYSIFQKDEKTFKEKSNLLGKQSSISTLLSAKTEALESENSDIDTTKRKRSEPNSSPHIVSPLRFSLNKKRTQVYQASLSQLDPPRPFPIQNQAEFESYVKNEVAAPYHPLSGLLQKNGGQNFTFTILEKVLETYKSIDPKYSIDVLKSLPNVSVKQFKESLYFGQLVDGKREGKGIYLTHDGRVYEGEWLENEKNGSGTEVFPNGNSYQGEFVNSRADGYGTYKWYYGELYRGEWRDGIKCGYGEWIGVNELYKGDWKAGMPSGDGVYQKNKAKYQGKFHHGLKHGKGKEWHENGEFYEGEFNLGRIEGQGEYFWKNGSTYKGQFKDGLKHGKGRLETESGEKYEGYFIDEKKNGLGIYEWPSGNVYKGAFKNDLRSGYGEMYWKDGSYYKGNWKSGLQHGEGEMYSFDDCILKGKFENNIFIDGEEISVDEAKKEEIIEENEQERIGIYSKRITHNSMNHLSPIKIRRNVKVSNTLNSPLNKFDLEHDTIDILTSDKKKLPTLFVSPRGSKPRVLFKHLKPIRTQPNTENSLTEI